MRMRITSELGMVLVYYKCRFKEFQHTQFSIIVQLVEPFDKLHLLSFLINLIYNTCIVIETIDLLHLKT